MINKAFLILALALAVVFLATLKPDQGPSQTSTVVEIEQGEYWWFGVVNHGHLMPLEAGYRANLDGFIYGNQANPLLLSNKGRYIWSDDAFRINVDGGRIHLEKPEGGFIIRRAGSTLREAYLAASNDFFPTAGSLPHEALFLQPQYNTWIELLYDQNQEDVLKYAHAIIDNGMPPGVMMIDDNWQRAYGDWEFRAERFPDPKAMVDELHAMGFKVMMWVCPFISPDTEVYRYLRDRGLLLMDRSGDPKIVPWWNGQSALLDLTVPEAGEWFRGRLDHLMETYGVDGFKLDAGDPEYYVDVIASKDIAPNDHAELFAEIGLHYTLNEYRATWKMGGQPLAQRLRDKGHSWEDLHTLIPHMLTSGLSGYAFTCPDMIGGGLMGSFINLEKVDQELMVRSAQTHAFMPMMQFSVAPWRVLNEEHFEATKQAIEKRARFVDRIMELAHEAARTGEPIVRYMEYEYPGHGYATVTDQFLLGSDILVAPVLQPGAVTREVIIPPGEWRGDDGRTHTGPGTISRPVTLNDIPHYVRVH
jgi:alpha-glucosidase (family GH31 glycosyl hydrolase)